MSSSGYLPENLQSRNHKPNALVEAMTGRTARTSQRPWGGGQAGAVQRDTGEPPSWLREGEKVGYMSKSTGRVMEVFIEKVSKLKREVTFTFVEDRRIWKKIPFSMLFSSSSPLQPLRAQTRSLSSTSAAKPGLSGSGSITTPVKDKAAVVRQAPDSLRLPAPEVSKGEPLRPAVAAKPEKPRPKACVGSLVAKVIADSAITASSYFMNNPRNGFGQMWRARLDNSDSAWRAAKDNTSQCVRWDFGSVKRLVKVQTRGNAVEPSWVTEYDLSHSMDGSTWTRLNDPTLLGNMNRDGLQENDLNPPVVARYVRLHPLAWNEHISLRAEFLGWDHKEPVEEQEKEELGPHGPKPQHDAGHAARSRSRSRSRSC